MIPKVSLQGTRAIRRAASISDILAVVRTRALVKKKKLRTRTYNFESNCPKRNFTEISRCSRHRASELRSGIFFREIIYQEIAFRTLTNVRDACTQFVSVRSHNLRTRHRHLCIDKYD